MTKFYSLFIFFFGILNCIDQKTGTFETSGIYEEKITVVRKKNFEVWSFKNSKRKVKYDIKWLDDCSYISYNRKVIKGKDDVSDLDLGGDVSLDTLYNRIKNQDKRSFTLSISVPKYHYSNSMIFEKIK